MEDLTGNGNGPYIINKSDKPVTITDFRIRPEQCGYETSEQPRSEDPDVTKIVMEYATAMADSSRRKRKAIEDRLAKSQAVFKEPPQKKKKFGGSNLHVNSFNINLDDTSSEHIPFSSDDPILPSDFFQNDLNNPDIANPFEDDDSAIPEELNDGTPTDMQN
jgi:hypothetical protein